jgi:hypothetical protein
MSVGEKDFRMAVKAVLLGLALSALPIHAQNGSDHEKILRRLLAPFRSNPFRVDSSRPCGLGFTTCFLPSDARDRVSAVPAFGPAAIASNPSRLVVLELRTQHRGPFCHHWLQTESSLGPVTLGYGPATVPFIDAGQISLRDAHGNIERISGMFPIPLLGLPPLSYQYAKSPGSGHVIKRSVVITLAQADTLIQKERKRKFVGPYVPIFHDCRTYTCSILAAAKGKSSLPCYLLFKGYW